MSILPDRTEAEKHIAALTGSAAAEVTFQTYADPDELKEDEASAKRLTRILHGSVQRNWPELVRLNAAGAGVFLMVNAGDGKGRKAENVRELRALFADDDSGTLTPQAVELTPTLIVQSKHGIHPYWRLHGGQRPEEFKPAQLAIAKALQTDPQVNDPCRVMRLAGFLHQKDRADPFLVRVVQANENTHSIAEVLEGCGARIAPKESPRQRVSGIGQHPYGGGALRSATTEIRGARNGDRNRVLNEQAFGIGQLVGGGVIARATAEAELEVAALEAGLTVAETRGTIRSGLNAGEKQPRGVPDDWRPREEPPIPENENPPEAQPKRPYLTHVLTPMSSVEAKPVSWLWPHRIAFGKPTIIDGDPGNLKSTLMLDVTARVTTGRPMPGEDKALCDPMRVLLVSVEDDAADTLRPRLEAAGADLSRVDILTIEAGGQELLPALSDHLPQIEAALLESGAKLLILDPLAAMMGRANMWKDQEVRAVLGPLKPILERTMAACVAIRHFNKTQGGSALYRGGGSIGIAGSARSVLAVGRDPREPARRVLALVKSNNAEVQEVPSLAYHAEKVQLGAIETIRIVWEGTSPYTADELLAAQIPQTHEDRSALDDAKAFLTEMLADGSIPSRDLDKQAKEVGISVTTLKRAREMLGIKARRTPDGRWLVGFPINLGTLGTLAEKDA